MECGFGWIDQESPQRLGKGPKWRAEPIRKHWGWNELGIGKEQEGGCGGGLSVEERVIPHRRKQTGLLVNLVSVPNMPQPGCDPQNSQNPSAVTALLARSPVFSS